MTRTIPPWQLSDAATYDTLRAQARVLEALLLRQSASGGLPEQAREELAEIHASVAAVDGFRRAEVVALLDVIESRIREVSDGDR